MDSPIQALAPAAPAALPVHPGTVGLWTASLDALAPAEAGQAVAEVEELGFSALWFGEAYGREAFTAAGLYLAASRRIVVATGIANIYGRDAVTANAAARTLDAAFPGRFLMGLGVSHQPLVERMRGHDYTRPLSAMRDYLQALDAAPYFAAGASTRPTRVLAALGPKMLALSAERADGAHPYLTTPEHTAMARELLGPEPLLCVEQAAVLEADEDEWERRSAWYLEIYTGLPNYRGNWERLGFSAEDFHRGGSTRLKSALVTRGLEATVARVREHLAAGATHVCVQVLGQDVAAVPSDQWRELGAALPDMR